MSRRKKDHPMVSKQNPPENEVSPAAFLNGAKRNGEAANLLLCVSRTSGIGLDPIYILYFLAAELALKAFLVFKGMKTKELESRLWGHRLEKLHDEAILRGLTPKQRTASIFVTSWNCSSQAIETRPSVTSHGNHR
jgi:hypothetical protein